MPKQNRTRPARRPAIAAGRIAIEGSTSAQIAESIELGVREGRVAAGARLPTVRGLAEQLRVSPTTVAAAYRVLRGRGVVVAYGRRGTRISPAAPVPASAVPASLPPGALDLATGNPDPALLPRLGPALARLAASDPEPHLYGEEIQLPRLIELARADFERDGIPADALAVTSGALDGIERVLLAHLRPGDRIAVEDPGFPGVLFLLRALGLVLDPVAVDDSGPLPDSLDAALRRGARAFVLTPRAQNPTGATLDEPRATELRSVLRHHEPVVVVEDDHGGESAGARAISLASATPRFAVVRSVSKTLGPDLRVALLAGDAQTVSRVEGRQVLGSRWVSHLLQRLVVLLWSDAAVVRQLRGASLRYAERREALVGALAAHGIEAHGRSGLNVWVPVREETPVVQRLLEAGFAVRAGEAYRLASPPALRITTAALPAERAAELADALAAALARPVRTQPA